jgi:hypothetical protein
LLDDGEQSFASLIRDRSFVNVGRKRILGDGFEDILKTRQLVLDALE